MIWNGSGNGNGIGNEKWEWKRGIHTHIIQLAQTKAHLILFIVARDKRMYVCECVCECYPLKRSLMSSCI